MPAATKTSAKVKAECEDALNEDPDPSRRVCPVYTKPKPPKKAETASLGGYPEVSAGVGEGAAAAGMGAVETRVP